MLRDDSASTGRRVFGIALVAVVGAAAAGLVALGNPGNMGICGACFLRDVAGSLKLFVGPAAYMRPEVPGLIFGALIIAVITGRFAARSGGFAAGRFLAGVLMAVGALVFLGCPFRTLQRLGGGDLNAWIGFPGFIAGTGIGLWLERRGYSAGKTQPSPAPLGLVGPLLVAVVFALFVIGGILAGPGRDPAVTKPPHAAWLASLGIALAAGAVLSATGFCASSATRQIFSGPKAMFFAMLALIGGYAIVALIMGKFSLSLAPQPVAHSDWLWNVLSLGLLGITSVLAGGCPVRQMVVAGEGNSDAFVCVSGIIFGGALAHNFGLVSAGMTAEAAGGSTPGGRIVVSAGLVLSLIYGYWVARSLRRQLQ